MESITWSAIISGIALIAAILSPVITTVLTNRHEDRVWIRRNVQERKVQIITDYIRNTGTILKYANYEQLVDYGKSYGEIFAYAPKEAFPLILSIDRALMNLPIRSDQPQRDFDKLCELLVPLLQEDVKPEKREKHAK